MFAIVGETKHQDLYSILYKGKAIIGYVPTLILAQTIIAVLQIEENQCRQTPTKARALELYSLYAPKILS